MTGIDDQKMIINDLNRLSVSLESEEGTNKYSLDEKVNNHLDLHLMNAN